MPDEVFAYCEICDKNFSGPEPYVEHLQSKGHHKKETETLGKKDPYAPKEPGNQYYCESCSIGLSGPEPYKQHMNGAKHKAQVERLNIVSSIKNSEHENASSKHIDIGDDVLTCKVCNKCFSGPKCLDQHLQSKKHSRKVQVADFSERLTGGGVQPSCPGMEQDHKNVKTPFISRAEARPTTKKPTGCLSGFGSIFKKSDKSTKKVKKVKSKPK